MTRANGCTIEEFADATGIPASFLAKVGVTEVKRRRHQAVRLSDAVTYLVPPQDGTGDGDAVERRGNGSALFGLDSLDLLAEAGSVYLVADEIEALTLRFHGLPALAVPPVARWADDWPALADAASVFVLYSGAADESAPPAWIADAPFRDRARLLHLAELRTGNMLHRGTSHFRAAWDSVCNAAISWSEHDAQERAARRAEAASRCADLVNAPDILARFAHARRIRREHARGEAALPRRHAGSAPTNSVRRRSPAARAAGSQTPGCLAVDRPAEIHPARIHSPALARRTVSSKQSNREAPHLHQTHRIRPARKPRRERDASQHEKTKRSSPLSRAPALFGPPESTSRP